MAITYNAGTDIITVTGYTEGTPCTFLDIYNADVAGSWGQVTRQCTSQFCFDCKLMIGDGSTATWFADEGAMVKFNSGIFTGNSQVLIELKNNSHFRLGKLLNDATRSTNRGCLIVAHTPTYIGDLISARSAGAAATAVLELYGTTLQMATERAAYLYSLYYGKIYNTRLENGILPNSIGLTIDNLVVAKGHHGIGIAFAASATFKNTTLLDYSNFTLALYQITQNSYLINPVVTGWNIEWTAPSTGKIYRQYEFDLKVIDKDNVAINGATVKIWDKDSNLIVDTTTNASGVITTRTITRGYYDLAHGNTLQEASPHLIKIEKVGYTTYEADFTLEEKTDWLIALQVGGGLMRNPPMTGGMV